MAVKLTVIFFLVMLNEKRVVVLMQTKKEFRKLQIKRMQESQAETREAGALLAKKLFSTKLWQDAKTIGLVKATPLEVPTDVISKQAKLEGKTIYYPRTMPKRQMAFLQADTPEDFEVSSFNILEPKYDPAKLATSLDLIIVPGIAYALDSKKRIGYGGGYYDRFLGNFSGNTVALVPPVMSYDTAAWPIEDFDVTIQHLITL